MKAYLSLVLIPWLFGAVTAAASPTPVKNFPLVNQEGKPFQLYDLKGKYVLVTFIYSRCPLPKMCPLSMTLSNRVIRKWKQDKTLREKAPLHALAVTLDPEYDTASVLKKYGKQHGVDFKHFTLATGVPQALSDLAAEFNVIGFPVEGMISHNSKHILLGPDMVEIAQYKENEWKADDVMEVLKKQVKGPSGR